MGNIHDEVNEMFSEYSDGFEKNDLKGLKIYYDWGELIRIYRVAKITRDKEEGIALGK